MLRIFEDIKTLMTAKGWDVDLLAVKIQKEPTSVRKQLNPKTANPQLSSLELIAHALDAEVRILVDDPGSFSTEDMISRIKELEGAVREKAEDLETLQQTAADLRERIRKRDEIIESMYHSLESKDEVIKTLLSQKGVI